MRREYNGFWLEPSWSEQPIGLQFVGEFVLVAQLDLRFIRGECPVPQMPTRFSV